ncbi:hypothetical protein [Listeria booriae]|uniref:Uncharacterized protein n=1 Tax=Listeria booriae TaxID=1552123 RepID=A0A7X1CIE2_9LIST|nr:hypothetical protein [Listeria booriae]MBC1778932.1 hypothetical protein [Listeria booriae]
MMIVTPTMLAQYTTHHLITEVLVENIGTFEKYDIVGYFSGCNREQIIFFKCLIYMDRCVMSFDDAHTIFSCQENANAIDLEMLLHDAGACNWYDLCVNISNAFALMRATFM